MSQKNETTVLVLALLITVALLGGGFWWFTRGSGFNIGSLSTGSKGDAGNKTPSTGASPSNQPNPSIQATAQSFAHTKLRSNVVDLQEYVVSEKSALPQKDSQWRDAERPLKGG